MKQFFLTDQNFLLFGDKFPVISGIHPITYYNDILYYPHEHYIAAVVFQLNGKSEQWIGDNSFNMEKGDFLIINKDEIHSEKALKRGCCKLIGISFTETNVANLPGGQLIPDGYSPIVHAQDCFKEVVAILREIEEINYKTNHYNAEILRLGAMKIICHIYKRLEKYEDANKKVSELVKNVTDYINLNYSKTISTEMLAKNFFVSQSHLLHKMSDELNSSPRKYQINRRIGEAQWRLIHDNDSINSISAAVGYENVNYFIKLFKERVGISPLEFRRQLSLEENTII